MTTWGVRVCPHSDAECKRGMSCPYTCATDAYDGTKALLPPAPDGGTEGLSEAREALQDVFNYFWNPDVDRPSLSEGEVSSAVERALKRLSAPSVSPVGPKEDLGSYRASEEAAPSGATASWRDIGSAPTEPCAKALGWCVYPAGAEVRFIQRDHGGMWVAYGIRQNVTHWMPLPNPPASVSPLEDEGKPPSDATYAENPSSQPTQTGEENAGLVELIATAKEAIEWVASDPNYDPRPVMRRLIDAASRSPIPGELKALSDAASAGPWEYERDHEGSSMGWIGRQIPAGRGTVFSALFDVCGDSGEQETNAVFASACVNHIRQALAKTHQVAEGGVASSADSA